MTKLEKSIRREMKFFGPALRNGHWGTYGHAAGAIPNDFKHLKKACCDFENGEVTAIRLYGVGDGQLREDYYGESLDITEPISEYLRGENYYDWDSLISDILDVILLSEKQEIR